MSLLRLGYYHLLKILSDDWRILPTSVNKPEDLSFGVLTMLYRLNVYLRDHQATVLITSGYRTPEEQRELRLLWDSGARSDHGLRAKPSLNSLHTVYPARAVDMSILNDQGRVLLRGLGAFAVRLGYYWSVSDDVHFSIGR